MAFKTITVFIPEALQKLTGGKKSFNTFGRTVGEALHGVCGPFPALKKALVDKDNRLLNTIQIRVNNTVIHENRIDYAIQKGDGIYIDLVES